MKYKRILLKLSGEALMGDQNHGIDPIRLNDYATEIKKLQETKNYVEYLRFKNPKFLITKNKDLKDHFLKGCMGNIYKVSQNFTKSTRNPFNRGDNYKIYIYHFNYDKLNYCTNLNNL